MCGKLIGFTCLLVYRKIIVMGSQWEHKNKPNVFFVLSVNKDTAETQCNNDFYDDTLGK